jgi:glycosyltransferase involved in cell wall biosynthesis
VSQALHRLNILAVPSAAIEASSRVIMEAFSAGTCVVAYPSGGIPEIVRDGDTGLLTDAPAYDSLARSIRKLADNPGLRARLVESGRREWEQRFRVQRFQREVCDTLQRMVSAPGNAATLPRSAGPGQEFAHDGTPFRQ